MGDEPCSRPSVLFHGQLDSNVVALFTVVQSRDGPRQPSPLWVVGRMIIKTVVSQLLHESPI
jgi:hypothetical protein